MKNLLILAAILIAHQASARVDTIDVFSKAMNKNVRCVVITPKNYGKSSQRFPVLYLLHGYAGRYDNWIRKAPVIDSLANAYRMIIVCPDGAFSSWYFDSPVDSGYRYETFIAVELPQAIDQRYRTVSSRKARAITGLSMGGHGAMFLALRHPQTFGACGSMSGVMDFNHIKRGYDISKRLGDTLANKKYYEEWSVNKLLESYDPKDSLAVIIDCGMSDFIFAMSRTAHEKMVKLRIPHDYIERPGLHDWRYWSNAVKYQLLYFREWFRRNNVLN